MIKLLFQFPYVDDLDQRNLTGAIDEIIKLHHLIHEACQIANEAFGFILLVTMTSIICDLITSTYYCIMQIYYEQGTFLIYATVIWTGMQLLRLVILLEPCHRTVEEV